MAEIVPIFEGDTGLSLKDIEEADNVDLLLTQDQSDRIGHLVVEDYRNDLQSRSEWEEGIADHINLALQVKKNKSFPWPNASNVKFPLLTIASLQFAARAYPALVRPPSIVRMRVVGDDEGGEKRQRAARVAEHMSYQLLDEDEGWEDNHDKLLAVLPIVGVAFKKSYFSPELGHNVSELILPHECVVNYWATNIEDASCITHVLRLSSREITERQRSGLYTEKDLGKADKPKEPLPAEREKREPSINQDHPHQVLEQHRWLDLDKDGLEEPYVVTVDVSSRKVLRIRPRFKSINRADNGRIINITPIHHFTKYGFLPAPDGSFYDLGFGTLLGPINESVNTLINQLIDSGTMQNGSRGFLGRGARFKGGQIRFTHPFEWIPVSTTGQSLKDSIVPLPVNEPSNVLFSLLGMLVNYGERISSVTDMMLGENPGQNTPAYTSQKMLEQGMQVFTGIFKRIYRNMRDEFRKLYELNGVYLDPETYYTVHDGEDRKIFQKDYQGQPNDISPAADPNSALREQKLQKATMILERSQVVPGYNIGEVEREFLEAIEHPSADKIYPMTPEGTPAIPPPPNPEIEVKLAEEQRRQLEGQQRGETQRQEVIIKAMVAEGTLAESMARTQLLLAQAENEKNEAGFKAIELELKGMQERREMLQTIIEDAREAQRIEVEKIKAQKSGASTGSD